jgi:hypothetical protein
MSNAFSFRLSAAETEWVKLQALPGETQHQTAQRLIRQLYTDSVNSVDNLNLTVDKTPVAVYNNHSDVDSVTDIVDSRIQQKVEELESDLYSRLSDQLNGLLETRLGESVA